MNKKILTSIIGAFLALSLISGAVLTYYAFIPVVLNVEQPIQVDSDGEQIIDCVAGEVCDGEPITVSNSGSEEREVKIIGGDLEDGISVRYLSNLILTEKTVNFSSDLWEIPEGAETVEIEFTIAENGFDAEVVDGFDEDYALIYYKDFSDRLGNPAKAILVEDVLGNLPYDNDGNKEDNDYCATGEYDTCHGAKIWYVPEDAINLDGSLDWSKASEFFYETGLIQYNEDGDIVVYSESSFTFTPEYTLDKYLEGLEYSHNITVQ